jgi:hypothetical protein
MKSGGVCDTFFLYFRIFCTVEHEAGAVAPKVARVNMPVNTTPTSTLLQPLQPSPINSIHRIDSAAGS